MLAIGWGGSLGTAKAGSGMLKGFSLGPFGFLIRILYPTFHCLKKSSLSCCHLWLQKYFIQSPLWSQRPKSDFNSSPAPTAEAFLRAASHRVIADAESESVGLSTLRHNFNAPARRRQHPHKSQLQSSSALGKCANRTQWAE